MEPERPPRTQGLLFWAQRGQDGDSDRTLASLLTQPRRLEGWGPHSCVHPAACWAPVLKPTEAVPGRNRQPGRDTRVDTRPQGRFRVAVLCVAVVSQRPPLWATGLSVSCLPQDSACHLVLIQKQNLEITGCALWVHPDKMQKVALLFWVKKIEFWFSVCLSIPCLW